MVSPYWVCSANLVKACGMVTTSSMYRSKKPDTVQTVQGWADVSALLSLAQHGCLCCSYCRSTTAAA